MLIDVAEILDTSDAARLLAMDADIGTLEAGKYADLLVIDGDPLRDITILDQPERIEVVMKGGRAYVDRLSSAVPAMVGG